MMRPFAFISLPLWAAYASAAFSLRSDLRNYTFDYSTSSPNEYNWVGLYYADGGPKNGAYVQDAVTWNYAPESNGTVWISPAGLEPGTYEVYFLADGGYESLADPITVDRTPDPVAFYADEITLQNGRVGDAFSANVSGLLGGGGGGITAEFSIASSAGADWLTLSPDGGLSGTPTAASQNGVQLNITALGSDNSTSNLFVTIPVVPAEAALVEQLSVLSWNLWFGGVRVDDYHAKQVAFLAKSNLDIVVVQESWRSHTTRLARAMGWNSWQSGNSVGIMSRYPIVEKYPEQNHGGSVRVALDGEDLQINVWAVHLGYNPYGPYGFCFDGMTTKEVFDGEESSGRTGQIKKTVSLMKKHISNANKIPVLLAGDFNAPSQLDWTDETSSSHCGTGSIKWPTSKAPLDAGLIDSYREKHTDPVSVPGITWSPIYLNNTEYSDRAEPKDRIDFIYYKGRLQVDSAETVVVGKPKPEPDHYENQWTSDHAAVLVKYSVTSGSADDGEKSAADSVKLIFIILLSLTIWLYLVYLVINFFVKRRRTKRINL